jgi:hypothetical protein
VAVDVVGIRQVSSAVPPHNEELLAARAYGLPVLKRDAYLAQVRTPAPLSRVCVPGRGSRSAPSLHHHRPLDSFRSDASPQWVLDEDVFTVESLQQLDSSRPGRGFGKRKTGEGIHGRIKVYDMSSGGDSACQGFELGDIRRTHR